MATLDTLLDTLSEASLREAIEGELEIAAEDGHTADDVAAAGPPAGLESEVFFLVADLPEHEQDAGAALARAELVRIWADEVREYVATRLARAA